jgi:hypothetical protein
MLADMAEWRGRVDGNRLEGFELSESRFSGYDGIE